MKRIAMICFGDVLSPKNGYVLKCWLIADQLRKDGNEVTIYQFCDYNGNDQRDGMDVVSMKAAHESKEKGWLEKTLTFNPFKELLFPFDSYRMLKSRIPDNLSGYDEIYIEGTLLLGPMIFAKKSGKRIVLDTHCLNKAVAMKMMQTHRVAGFVRKVIWNALESYMMGPASVIIAVSENDKEFIEANYNVAGKEIIVIPHAVNPADGEKFAKEAGRLKPELVKGYKYTACYIGDYGAIQNREAAHYIIDELAPATRDVHYVMIGNNESAKYPSKENVTFLGFVDSFDPYIMAVDFCIAPMAIGSGVKTKVLDYMKYGKIVIGTPVAFEGIEPDINSHVCELREFIGKVKEVSESL